MVLCRFNTNSYPVVKLPNLLHTYMQDSTVVFLFYKHTTVVQQAFADCIGLKCIATLYKFNVTQIFSNHNSYLNLSLHEIPKHLIVKRISNFDTVLIVDFDSPRDIGSPLKFQYGISPFGYKPNVMVLPALQEVPPFKPIQGFLPFNSVITLFVTDEYGRPTSLKLACFICLKAGDINWRSIAVESIPEEAKGSVTLYLYWLRLHSNFSALGNSERPSFVRDSEASCQKEISACNRLLNDFFLKHHCTNEEVCMRYFLYDTALAREEQPRGIIFPFGQNEVFYTFNHFYLKEHVMNSNLNAFSYPFDRSTWVFISGSFFGVLLCMQLKHEKLSESITSLFASLLEQGCDVSMSKLSTAMLCVWAFSGIFYRNFYCSSLFTYMTAQPVPKNMPSNIKELLIHNNSNYLIFAPNSLSKQIMWNSFDRSSKTNLALLKAGWFLSDMGQVIDAAINGWDMYDLKIFYPLLEYNESLAFESHFGTTGLASQFALITDSVSNDVGHLAFFLRNSFKQLEQKTERFLSTFEFWSQGRSHFMTRLLEKFFGQYMQSGLYERHMQTHRKNEEVKKMESYNYIKNENQKAGNQKMWNFYAYVFLSGSGKMFDEETWEPVQLTAVFGGIIIFLSVNGAAILVFVFEIINCVYRLRIMLM